MNKRNKFYLLVCVCLCLLVTQALWAQTRVTIKLYGTDGSGVTDSLTLCVDPAGHNDATADSLTPTLKESSQGLPPPPQGVDMRVIPNSGWDGLANYTSIHHLAYDTQGDRWKIQIQRDAAQSAMDFSWASGLGGVGLGYWKLIGDENDADAGVAAVDVDMTAQTALHLPLGDTDPHTLYLIKGDGARMRTFTPDDIADAVDSKGKKTKAEKRKAYASEACFTFHYAGDDLGGPATAVFHIEFSQAAVGDASGILGSGGLTAHTADATGKQSKWDFDLPSGDTLHDGDAVQICFRGNKGKALAIKKWSLVGVKQATLPTADVVAPYPARLLLRMPNVNNIGEEAYAQNAWPETFNTKPAGIVIGTQDSSGMTGGGKLRYKFVYHPKWKDVTKTFADKTGKHNGAANCLDSFTSTKPIEKAQKSLPPGKMNNVLLAEALALAFNIGIGDPAIGKTETDGLGDMIYVNQPGDPAGLPAGSTVSQIDGMMDLVMSCKGSAPAGTFAEWQAVCHRINAAFSGPFDTTSFGQIQGTKTAGGTIATGVRAIAEAGFLYRTSVAAAPAAYHRLDLNALESAPKAFNLMQNYPNPFNPTTTIEFSLPEEAVVTLKVYNMLGQEVATLLDNEQMTDGTQEVQLNAANFASGVYFYRIIAQGLDEDGNLTQQNFTTVKKMLLMK